MRFSLQLPRFLYIEKLSVKFIGTKMEKMRPLCVDLDNTFLKTNLFLEGFLKLVKSHFFKLPRFLTLCFLSRAKAKRFLSEHIDFNYSSLPVNPEILSYCQQEAQKGRPVFLVTGAQEAFASGVCREYPFFSGYYATNEERNLTGQNKADHLVKIFGEKNFDYIGDSPRVDRPVWKASHTALTVGSKESLFKTIQNRTTHFSAQKNSLRSISKLLRPQQWLKNSLVFLPLFLAHKLGRIDVWFAVLPAFFAFCFAASSVYIMNDLLDIDSDRQHKKKKNRPLASGDVSVLCGLLLFSLFFVTTAVLSVRLGALGFSILLIYFVLNIFYSFWLKKLILIDVMALTSFYMIRIILGGVVAGIVLSPWMRAFSFFIFLSLAFLKRYSEVANANLTSNKGFVHGRGYEGQDEKTLFTFGTISAFVSVLVFCQYIYQSENATQYSRPDYLWGAAVLILYWLLSVWLRASRGQVNDDPLIFVLKDRTSLLIGFCFVAIMAMAI